LFAGARVAKDHQRIEAYGTVDELNACLGVARAAAPPTDIDPCLEQIQHQLFALGAELATPNPEEHGLRWADEAASQALERLIDRFEAQLPPLRQFILPAGTGAAAALHQARAVCRRAERRVVTLRRADASVSLDVIIYLNRLGDLLFVLARAANVLAGFADHPWQKPLS
jgi:cob(I)alamin adenosyltransferase